MSPKAYPLLFKPIYKDYIWGGDRISRRFNRTPPVGRCAESWEIADRSEGMSVVANGPLAGKSLHDLVASMKHDLIGSASDSPVFPLLIKILDARQRLSLQVHPDDKSAALHGGEPKTEMWCVLDAEPDAMLFAGFKHGARPDSLPAAIEQGRMESLLGSVSARVGEALYVPGGLVHAIGEGCLLLEIQQNSDTTYRVYDWGRLGNDGKPRQTHVKQAMEVINWDLGVPTTTIPRKVKSAGGNSCWEILKSPYFHVSRLDLSRPEIVTNDGASFHALFVASGRVNIEGNGATERLDSGTSCLLPAVMSAYNLAPVEGSASIIRTGLV